MYHTLPKTVILLSRPYLLITVHLVDQKRQKVWKMAILGLTSLFLTPHHGALQGGSQKWLKCLLGVGSVPQSQSLRFKVD